MTANNKPDTMTIGKPGVAVGSRTRPAVVHRLSDTVPVPILSQFDGRFTVYILAGDLEQPGALERLLDLDQYIRESNGSLFSRYGHDIVVEDKEIPRRMPKLRIPKNDDHSSTSTNGHAMNGKSLSNGNGHSEPTPFPAGRVLYSYDYDDIPQITGDYVARPHSLIRVSIVTTSGTSSDVIMNKVMDLLYPTADAPEYKKQSRIFRPQHFFCDDIPIISPYRESAPEEGLVFENPMHRKWGVDPALGSIIVARPDGHAALRASGFGREAWSQVEAYFNGFLAEKQV